MNMNKVDRPYTIKAVVNLATIKIDLKLVPTQIVFGGYVPLSLSILILNSQCVEGARAVRVL